ncbi:MAG TPA: hypothetical protein VM534_07270, partial [Thermoanaerobaculia bacterium]|nr:hypothetical protein [Thermoanaerobaculia bacterium]
AIICTSDGTQMTVGASDLRTITGPSRKVDRPVCCPAFSEGEEADFVLASGESLQAVFVDSCFAYDQYFSGRSYTTGDARYALFSDLTRLVFP